MNRGFERLLLSLCPVKCLGNGAWHVRNKVAPIDTSSDVKHATAGFSQAPNLLKVRAEELTRCSFSCRRRIPNQSPRGGTSLMQANASWRGKTIMDYRATNLVIRPQGTPIWLKNGSAGGLNAFGRTS